jgi:hypothetical protein
MNYFDWIAMICIIYMVSYNYAIHVTCLLALMTYKYSELQSLLQLKNWVTGLIA